MNYYHGYTLYQNIKLSFCLYRCQSFFTSTKFIVSKPYLATKTLAYQILMAYSEVAIFPTPSYKGSSLNKFKVL
jgi:hypothetical protein